MYVLRVELCLVALLITISGAQLRKKVDDKINCPKVKAIRNFDLEQVSGFQQYIISFTNYYYIYPLHRIGTYEAEFTSISNGCLI